MLGAYSGNQGDVSAIAGFAAETGADITATTQYNGPQSSWANLINDTNYLISLIGGMPYRLLMSCCLIPIGGSLTDSTIAANHTTMAQAFNNAGFGNAIVRIPWENNIATSCYNSSYVPWMFADNPNFNAASVTAIEAWKAVSSGFKFDFNTVPGVGNSLTQTTIEYLVAHNCIDVMGSDPYDQAYSPPGNNDPANSAAVWTQIVNSPYDGLQAQANYATEYGLRIGWQEYGCGTGSSGFCGDDPLYVSNTAEWASSHDLWYISWFDQNQGGLDTSMADNPNSLARYQSIYG